MMFVTLKHVLSIKNCRNHLKNHDFYKTFLVLENTHPQQNSGTAQNHFVKERYWLARILQDWQGLCKIFEDPWRPSKILASGRQDPQRPWQEYWRYLQISDDLGNNIILKLCSRSLIGSSRTIVNIFEDPWRLSQEEQVERCSLTFELNCWIFLGWILDVC